MRTTRMMWLLCAAVAVSGCKKKQGDEEAAEVKHDPADVLAGLGSLNTLTFDKAMDLGFTVAPSQPSSHKVHIYLDPARTYCQELTIKFRKSEPGTILRAWCESPELTREKNGELMRKLGLAYGFQAIPVLNSWAVDPARDHEIEVFWPDAIYFDGDDYGMFEIGLINPCEFGEKDCSGVIDRDFRVFFNLFSK